MAERKEIDLVINTQVNGGENLDQSVDKVKTLKQQIKEAKLEVEKFEEGSEGFKKAAANVAALSDKLDDVNDQVKLLKGDALERVAGGFKGVGSAILDLDVGKLKLANESLKSIKFGDLIGNVKAFGRELFALATNPFFLIPTAIGLIISNFEELKNAFPPLKALVDGLGNALNVFIGKAGEAYEEQKKFNEQQQAAVEYTNEMAAAVVKESGEYVGLIFQLKSTNQNSKERADLIDKINSKYGGTIKNLQDEKLFQSQLNDEVARYLDIQRAKFNLQKNQEAINVQLEKIFKAEQERARIENIFRLQGKEGETLGDFAKRRSEYGKVLSETSIQISDANSALEKLGAAALDLNKDVPQEVKKASPVPKSKDVEKDLKVWEEFNKEVVNVRKIFSDQETKIEEEKKQKIAELDDKYKALEKDKKLTPEQRLQAQSDYLSALLDLELEATSKKNAITDAEKEKQEKLRQEQLDKEKAALDQFTSTATANFEARLTEEERIQSEGNQRKLELQAQFDALSAEEQLLRKQQLDDELKAIDKDTKDQLDLQAKESAEKQAKIEEDLNKKKLDAVKNGLSIISNLAELFAGKSRKQQERAFKVQKAVSIAQASISTAEAAISAYKSLAGIPVVGPALGGIASAAAIAAGLVQIKKIKEQKFEGGGPEPSPGPSPSPGDTGGPSAIQGGNQAPVGLPTFNLQGQQIGGAGSLLGINGQSNQNQPVRVYVTESDITNTQNKVQVVQGNSLFGSGGG
jgi:hypothetical protein